jgi:serine/threonine protein kinase
VACKRFHASRSSQLDSQRELENLQVLKESISFHEHIRIHLAILLHKGEHLILLPWADHLDLDIFLLEGHTFQREKLYDFKLRFPKIVLGDLVEEVCTQMLQIADALGWLHRGIIGRTHTNRVHFAHMDLKPNNILIDADGTSAVGKWVLTDFGISAFKEDNESDFSRVLSIRDLYENLTIKEAPRRHPGAYQPPEIQRIRNRASKIGNDAYQGVAGRKGDIWSFGCILSEVLTFALGQTLAVQTFRTARKSQGDDYFYEAEPTGLLDVQHQPASYRVRSKVKEWLRKLPEQYSFPNRAIDCCAQTILDILIVDGARRPKADDLVRKMEHVVHHVRTARCPGDLPYCPLKGPPANGVDPSSSFGSHTEALVPLLPNVIEVPSLTQTSPQLGETLLHPSLREREDGVAISTPAASVDASRRQDSSEPAEGANDFTKNHHVGLRSSDIEPNGPSKPRGLAIDFVQTESSLESIKLDPREPVAREARRNLHGVMIRPDRQREVRTPIEANLSDLSNAKIISTSLCPSGHGLAFLATQPKATHQSVYICKISMNDQRLELDGPSFSLPLGPEWKRLVHAGHVFVTWGNARGGSRHVS